MARTIIITQEQLDEICGANMEYLDNLDTKPGTARDFNNNITTDGDKGPNKPSTTTDDYAHSMTNNWRGISRLNGLGPICVRECTRQELEDEIINEINSNIQGFRFGAKDGTKGHTAQATAMAKSRLKKAQETVLTGSTQDKAKAQQTIDNMYKNEPNLNGQIKQFDSAVKRDENLRNAKVNRGERVLKFSPKQAGGKSHLKKGIITYNE